jgi:hypothetical protein
MKYDFVINIIFKIRSGYYSDIKDPDDLVPYTIDPRIYRGHRLAKTNHEVKYKDFVINSFQDKERKPY